jgi:hypothetical protein
MKILYIIKSCDSYYDTRVSFQKNTWLNKINNESDYITITSSVGDEKTYKCLCGDGYFSLTEKVKNFIKNNSFDKYDWYFLIDDDAFVFPERLEKYITENQLDCNSLSIIGNANCYFHETKEDSFCGGAGVLITKESINLIKTTISNDEMLCDYKIDDCFLFCISKKLELNIINNSPGDSSCGLFIPTSYKENHYVVEKLDSCVLLHNIRTEIEYKELYNKYYE